MIFTGMSGTKRVIELHKARSNEITTQVEADKAELEKLVGTSYLMERASYNNAVVLSKWNINYSYIIAGTCYVEEQIAGIPFTCTVTSEGDLYLGRARGYSNAICKFEYTTTDGIVHVDTRELGMLDVVANLRSGATSLRINQVVNHIRFVSDVFNPEQTMVYSYVFK